MGATSLTASPALSLASEIRSEHFTSVRPHPAVACLHADNESGYRNVYRAHTRDRWIAKVRINGRLTRLKGSASSLPHQAALHVVKWYQCRYGARWQAQAREGRGGNGKSPWRIWYSQARGGWLAQVWEFGKPVGVTGRRLPGYAAESFDTLANAQFPRRGWKTAGRLLVFASREAARAALSAWIGDRWGLFAEECVWRS